MNDESINELRERIDELNGKSTRVLMFLSFAIAAAVLMWSNSSLEARQKELAVGAMRSWIWAVFPVLAGILPVKEFGHNNTRWYGFLRWLKFVFLWLAVAFIGWGAVDFARAIYHR